MSAATPPFQPGDELGHYRILGVLGEGGMGQVYAAEDTRLGRKVAIKILPHELADDEERLARFEREARAIAALNHPNIVTLYSVEEADGLRFITMELVEGGSLADLMALGPIPLKRFFELAIPMVDGLHTAHQRGIVHRDLKPTNILLTPDGRPKILDFGLARLEADSSSAETGADMTLTLAGRVMGTVPYMSPEQVQGKQLDRRSDIFSLGIIFYEMASGKRPFRGETSADLISSILRDAPRPLVEREVNLPYHLGRIVRRALEKNPDRRYQTALDLRNELDDLRSEVETGVSELSGPRQAVRPRRHLGLVILLIVVLAAAIGVALWMQREPAPVPTKPPPRLRPALALMPMQNIGESANAYFAEGLSQELAVQLTQLEGLPVLAGWAVKQVQARGESSDPTRSPRWLIHGSIRWQPQEGESPRARMTFQLTDAASNTSLWSQSYDREVIAPLDVQAEIAGLVSAKIAEILLHQEPVSVEAAAVSTALEEATQAESLPGEVPRPLPEPRSKEQSGATVTERQPNVEAAEPGSGERTEPVPTVRLTVHFSSELPAGIVLVFADGEEVLRRQFRFEENDGLFRRSSGSGEFQESVRVPPDVEELRVYVTPEGRAARYVRLTPEWRRGTNGRLSIRLNPKGEASARFRLASE